MPPNGWHLCLAFKGWLRDCEASVESRMEEWREVLGGDAMRVRHVGQGYYCCQTNGPNPNHIVLDPTEAERQSVVRSRIVWVLPLSLQQWPRMQKVKMRGTQTTPPAALKEVCGGEALCLGRVCWLTLRLTVNNFPFLEKKIMSFCLLYSAYLSGVTVALLY